MAIEGPGLSDEHGALRTEKRKAHRGPDRRIEYPAADYSVVDLRVTRAMRSSTLKKLIQARSLM